MIKKKTSKILLVGDGAVGSSFAFSLLQQTNLDELVIVDLREDLAQGDTIDLMDVTPMAANTNIHTGSYSDATDADIVVITAGVPRKPGETRLDLVNKNTVILKSIIDPIMQSGFNGIFVVSSNPVDILTTITQRLSGFDKNRVIGTGTSLDTNRLRVILSQRLKIAVNEIDANVLGEHGDTSFVNFDEAMVNGQLLKVEEKLTQDEMDQIETDVHKRGGVIIKKKGATFYGVALSLARICAAILNGQDLVLPLSAPMTGQYGLQDIYLGTPTVVNSSGIQHVIELPLSDVEKKKMQDSAAKMKEVLDGVSIVELNI